MVFGVCVCVCVCVAWINRKYRHIWVLPSKAQSDTALLRPVLVSPYPDQSTPGQEQPTGEERQSEGRVIVLRYRPYQVD
jgi:hypothetical protein